MAMRFDADVFIPIAQGVVTIAMAVAGYLVSTRPVHAEPRKRRLAEGTFIVLGLALLGLIWWQAIRAADARNGAELAQKQASLDVKAAFNEAKGARKEAAGAKQEAAGAKEESARTSASLRDAMKMLGDLIHTSGETTTQTLLGRVPPKNRTIPKRYRFVMAMALAKVPTTYVVLALDGDQESMKLASDLCAVLKESKWQASAGCYGLAQYRGPLEGVWIWPRSAESTASANRLAALLMAEGVAAKVTMTGLDMSMETDGGLDIRVGSNISAITQKVFFGTQQMQGSKDLLHRP